jgi:hypothetical protein
MSNLSISICIRLYSLKRIKRRAGKTIGNISQEFLTLITVDERGRSLEVITEWQGKTILNTVSVTFTAMFVDLINMSIDHYSTSSHSFFYPLYPFASFIEFQNWFPPVS